MARCSPLHAVPPEILSTIALALAAARPLRPPRDLCSLRATCRHLRDALNPHHNPALWSTAFAARFDPAPVRRRNFRPNGRDYYDQLRQYTDTLHALRARNVSHPDIADVLRIAFVMLLENDGKNRAQLEAAGLDAFVDAYVRTRLWSQAHLRDGWPDDASASSFALWIKWLLTTPAQLQNESTATREEMVALVLPFVLNPYRYAQAEAPPCHFHLPLSTHASPVPQSVPSAHGPYPVYTPDQEVSYPYFGSLPLFSPPPIALAAKLLYFARREILPFNIPHHIPATRAHALPSSEPSPTQEDFVEFNAHKGAPPPARITWDWHSGVRLRDGVPDTTSMHPSAVWDCDYWRRRLCGNAWKRQPKWRPAKVYIPGSMDGLWQGRLVFPMQDALHQLIQQAVYPQHNFNELSLRVIHQPLFMRLTEHHSVVPDTPIPFPEEGSDDLSMKNAWLPGLPGRVEFSCGAREPDAKKTLVSIDGQHPHSSWIYTNFTRKDKKGEDEEEEEEHRGHENCEMCREREQLYRKAVRLDGEDLEGINEVYEGAWEEIERMFGSVGLSRDESGPMDEDDDDEDEVEGEEEEEVEEDGDVDIEDADAEDENEGELEFIDDPNADLQNQNQNQNQQKSSSSSSSSSAFITPVRRGTDRAKMEKCDGIRDIVFSGSTDRKHALAWNHFTFYGRIRPWDGLIGILRRAYWPTQSLLFFYGYLVGNESFVGNWRFAAVDPRSATWESAFVMSKRREE